MSQISTCPSDVYSTGCTFLSGAIAGALSRTLTAPFDRVKTIVQEGRYVLPPGQVSCLGLTPNSSLRDVFRMIYKESHLRGFWKGNGVSCLKAGPEFAMVFSFRRIMASSYERMCASSFIWNENEYLLRPVLHGGSSSTQGVCSNFIIGAFSGAAAQLILYPLELIKTRIIVSHGNEMRGSLRRVLTDAYHHGGVKEFYKGLAPNMAGIFFYRGVEVGLYSTMRRSIIDDRIRKENLSLHGAAPTATETAFIASLASICAQCIAYPLNVVRTRLQTQGIHGSELLYSGMIDCMSKIIIKRGIRGLFAGLSANFMKSVPATALTFVVFEKMQSILIGDEE